MGIEDVGLAQREPVLSKSKFEGGVPECTIKLPSTIVISEGISEGGSGGNRDSSQPPLRCQQKTYSTPGHPCKSPSMYKDLVYTEATLAHVF